MITESAIVIAYQNGVATVKCQAKSACGSCAAQNGCGTAALSELTGERGEYIFEIPTITALNVGQWVEIGLSERALLHSMLLLYALPLCVLLLATLISASCFNAEWLSALFIVLCTALSYWGVHTYIKKYRHKYAYRPILLRAL